MPVKSAIINHITYETDNGPVNAIVKMRLEKFDNNTMMIINFFNADSGAPITPVSATKMIDDAVITLIEGSVG